MSSRGLLVEFEQAAVLGGVVGGVVGPAAPDHADPGSGEDANGVWVSGAAGAGAVVDVFGPGAGLSAVGGEVDEGLA
jgi:hypothetical protein